MAHVQALLYINSVASLCEMCPVRLLELKSLEDFWIKKKKKRTFPVMQLESSNSHLFLYVSKAFESFLKYDYKLNKCMFLRVYVLLRIGIKCVSTQWNRA